MFEVDKDVPVLNYTKGRPRGSFKYPWSLLDINDSFLVPDNMKKTIYSLASHNNRRLSPKRFIGRKVDNGIRIWRVE